MRSYYAVFKHIIERAGVSLSITKHNLDILAHPDKLIYVGFPDSRWEEKTKKYIFERLYEMKLPFIAFSGENQLWFAELSKGYTQLAKNINLLYNRVYEFKVGDLTIYTNYRAFGFEQIGLECDYFTNNREIEFVCNNLGLNFVVKFCEVLYLNPSRYLSYRIALQPRKFVIEDAFFKHQIYDITTDVLTVDFLLPFSEIVAKTYKVLNTEIRQFFLKPLTSKDELLKAYVEQFLLPIFSKKFNITKSDLGIKDINARLELIKKLLDKARE